MGIASGLAQNAVQVLEQARIRELLSGKIDGDPNRGESLIAPAFSVGAHCIQNQAAYRADQTDFLGDGNEFSRQQQTPLRMPPPDKGLRTRDATRLDIDLRLVVNLEFAPRHGVAQLIFKGESLDAVHIDIDR